MIATKSEAWALRMAGCQIGFLHAGSSRMTAKIVLILAASVGKPLDVCVDGSQDI